MERIFCVTFATGCVMRTLNGAQPLAQPIDPASARRPRCRIGSRDDHCSGEPIGPRIEETLGRLLRR